MRGKQRSRRLRGLTQITTANSGNMPVCTSVCSISPPPLLPGFPVVLLLLWFAVCCPARAQARIVVVVCERLTWEDVNAGCPFLLSLMQQNRCAVGLMNTAVAGPKNADSAMLALAQGQLVASEVGDEQAVNSREAVGEESGTGAIVYRRRVGVDVPTGRTVVHLNVAALTRRGVIGQGLGAMLAQASPLRRILICGNADTDVRQRRGALLAIDAQGTATGDVALLLPDKSKPFGVTDDINTLARYGATTDADVFVAVLGDLARAEALRARLTPAAYHAARQEALSRFDGFLLQLLAVRHLDTETVDLLLVSPCPPAALAGQSASTLTASTTTGETWEQSNAPFRAWPPLSARIADFPYHAHSRPCFQHGYCPVASPCPRYSHPCHHDGTPHADADGSGR